MTPLLAADTTKSVDGVDNQFLGEIERTIPRSRPAFRIAGSAGRVKGAKRDRSHAQRSEHGEDPPFGAPEHPADNCQRGAEADEGLLRLLPGGAISPPSRVAGSDRSRGTHRDV